MPNILALVIKLLPSLVAIAEAIFVKPQSGEEKKKWVMNMADTIMGGLDVTLTGGASETWSRIRPLAGNIVDASAQIAFPHRDENPGYGGMGG